DHAGALGDFPHAEVHVYAHELQAALTRPSLKEKLRYVSAQWAHGPNWAPHGTDGERWMGFESITPLPDTDDEVLLVPLTGHTAGHCGVAVRADAGWLLHCGDAYFHHGEMAAEASCPLGLRVFQNLTQMDGRARRGNQRRLRELKARHGHEVRLFCAHDPVELAELAQQDALRWRPPRHRAQAAARRRRPFTAASKRRSEPPFRTAASGSACRCRASSESATGRNCPAGCTACLGAARPPPRCAPRHPECARLSASPGRRPPRHWPCCRSCARPSRRGCPGDVPRRPPWPPRWRRCPPGTACCGR